MLKYYVDVLGNCVGGVGEVYWLFVYYDFVVGWWLGVVDDFY